MKSILFREIGSVVLSVSLSASILFVSWGVEKLALPHPSRVFVGGKLKYDLDLNIEPQRLVVSAVTSQAASFVDWILMLQDLEVHLKVRFAEMVISEWSREKKLSDDAKMYFLKEIDKLSVEHPNQRQHDIDLSKVVATIAEKLELKRDLENMN